MLTRGIHIYTPNGYKVSGDVGKQEEGWNENGVVPLSREETTLAVASIRTRILPYTRTQIVSVIFFSQRHCPWIFNLSLQYEIMEVSRPLFSLIEILRDLTAFNA